MKTLYCIGITICTLLVCAGIHPSQAQGTLVGGPCEGCEAVFEYGDRTLTPVDTMPDFTADAENSRLKVTGTIYRPDGETPAGDVILYIYHTNAEGVYPTRGDESGWGRRHGYLRGWIKTDADGKFSFYTRKPGSYGSGPAHIHGMILEPDGKYYYIEQYRFLRDSNTDKGWGDHRGGSGVVKLKEGKGMLVAERDIILGKNINGYDIE